MSRRLLLSLVLASGLAGCLHGAPKTSVGGWDPQCEGTPAGHACLKIVFSENSDVYSEGKLTGDYYWALYNAGDVAGYGPDGPVQYTGTVYDVDLSAPGATLATYVPGIRAQGYQILCYLDANQNGDPDKGEPVTYPSHSFNVPADTMTTVESILDGIKPF